MSILYRIILFVLLGLTSFALWAKPIQSGNHAYTVSFPGTSLQVFTYKPNCPIQSILFIFHGNARNAKTYRHLAEPISQKLCALVVTPKFDKKDFPGWRYQRGGIVHHNELQKPTDWTAQMVLQLIDWVNQQEGRALPYALIGHSAGSQFLSRIAAYTPTHATRIVIANPSTYVLANIDTKAPYGLGGIYPSRKIAVKELKRYLATPLTIFIGEEDVTTKALNQSKKAERQGSKRYDRGLNVYEAAQELAKSHHWIFNWRLVTVPGVGHSAKAMFASPLAIDALSP